MIDVLDISCKLTVGEFGNNMMISQYYRYSIAMIYSTSNFGAVCADHR